MLVKILAKIIIYEHILLIFLIYFKNKQIQRTFQPQFLKNCKSDLAQIWELSLACFSLCKKTILLSNTATSFCFSNHIEEFYMLMINIMAKDILIFFTK